MSEQFDEMSSQQLEGEPAALEAGSPEPASHKTSRPLLEVIAQLGLGETVARVGATLLTFIGLGLVVWFMQSFMISANASPADNPLQNTEPVATPAVQASFIPQTAGAYKGIPRMALIHTTIPNRPREELTFYTVQEGDTVFGISEKYGLKPQTILWGNYYILRDDPHNLKPGQELNILPVDGTYYEWQAGDGLNGVATFFGVTPETIINYAGNNLDPATIGDFTNPNIKPGTWLIVPGGSRQFISWSAPIGVTRENPAIARQMGPGACGVVTDGAVGFGSFVWPSDRHYLSGFDYSPETNHRGLDIAAKLGEPIYAVDAGVVVYAGWNDWGYGNMIVIDHGNGWQSLYAHLSVLNLTCGMSAGQGTVIGASGSTGRSSGPHLHFELMHTSYGKVNPWDFLPAP